MKAQVGHRTWWVLSVIGWTLFVGSAAHAQTFVPVETYMVADQPLRPGDINLPNTTTTVYFPQGEGGLRFGTVVAGTNSTGVNDKLGWFRTRDANCQVIPFPAGWEFIGGVMDQYYNKLSPPATPHVGQILVKDLNRNILQNTVWGTYFGDCEYLWSQAAHLTNGANDAVAKPLPP